eukprot:COSAG01_NODE_1580_length_9830_cov_7.852826_7_plen_187_part_00
MTTSAAATHHAYSSTTELRLLGLRRRRRSCYGYIAEHALQSHIDHKAVSAHRHGSISAQPTCESSRVNACPDATPLAGYASTHLYLGEGLCQLLLRLLCLLLSLLLRLRLVLYQLSQLFQLGAHTLVVQHYLYHGRGRVLLQLAPELYLSSPFTLLKSAVATGSQVKAGNRVRNYHTRQRTTLHLS